MITCWTIHASPNASRLNAKHAELGSILKEAFAKRTREEWLDLFDKFHVPSRPNNSAAEALRDEQVRHREIVAEVPPGSGRRFVNVPIRLRDSAMPAAATAPKLGEHTATVLAEPGVCSQALEELQAEGVIC